MWKLEKSLRQNGSSLQLVIQDGVGVRDPLEQVIVKLMEGQMREVTSPSGKVFRMSWKYPTAREGRAHSSERKELFAKKVKLTGSTGS